jgi:hypothetical protein
MTGICVSRRGEAIRENRSVSLATDRVYGEKGRNMLKTDQMLWEQELAEHMNQYCMDLLELPSVTPPPPSRARTWLTRLMLWTPVALVGSTVGWSVGWYVV